MRWLIVAVALVGCERTETSPTPSPVRDAGPIDASVDCPRPPDVAARAAALERWAAEERATTRKTSPVEDLELTRAYVDLALAYGFARLGKRDQVAARLWTSAAILRPRADPIHDQLAAMYRERIDDALRCRAATAVFSPTLEASYAALDRMPRYKVDRLQEVSRTLTTRRVDAIGAFAKKQVNVFGDELERIRRMAPPDKPAALAALAGRPLEGVLDALATLPPSAARPIFDRLSFAGATPTVLGDALAIAASIDAPRARVLVDALAFPSATDYDALLRHSLPALKAHPAVVRTILERAAKLPVRPEAPPPIGLAAGYLALGDDAAAKPILDGAHAWLSGSWTQLARLDMIDGLVLAYRQAPTERGLAGIAKLSPHYAGITDSYGTNSHYNLSALHFNSTMVHGILGD